MQKATIVARFLLAILMAVMGLNKFMAFMPMPDQSGKAADFMNIVGTTYIMPTLGILYLFSAVLLVFDRAVGLACVILAPLAYNAFMFHLTLDPSNIALAAVWVALLVVVMIGNASKFRSLLT